MHILRRISGIVSLAILGAALPLHAAISAEGDDLVVVSVAGVQSPVSRGDLLRPGTDIAVGADTTIVLLAESGQMFQLNGPCDCVAPKTDDGPSAGSGPATRGIMLGNNLWKTALPTIRDMSKEPAVGNTAVSRDPLPGKPNAQPDLWFMAIDSSGHRCVRREGVMLWRKKADSDVTLDLRTQSVRQTGLTWPAGQQTMRLPDHFVVDGAPLVLSVGAQPRRLMLHVLPETINEREWGEILIWMAARECRRQAQFLVDGLNDGSLFPDRDRKPGLSEL